MEYIIACISNALKIMAWAADVSLTVVSIKPNVKKAPKAPPRPLPKIEIALDTTISVVGNQAEEILVVIFPVNGFEIAPKTVDKMIQYTQTLMSVLPHIQRIIPKFPRSNYLYSLKSSYSIFSS